MSLGSRIGSVGGKKTNLVETIPLDDLSDVTITSPADNELLAYDFSSGEWINQTPTEAGFAAVATTGNASDVNITDAGAYYTGTEVETALQEIGAGTPASFKWSESSNVLSPKTDGNGVLIDVPTTSRSALDLQTTDDNSTNNLLNILDSSDANLANISSVGVYTATKNIDITNQQTAGLAGEDASIIKTGGPNTIGQIIRGKDYTDPNPAILASQFTKANGEFLNFTSAVSLADDAAWSISFFVYWDSGPGIDIYGNLVTPGNFTRAFVDTGGTRILVYNDANAIIFQDTGLSLSNSTWYHFVLTCDGATSGTIELFIDTVSEGTTTPGGGDTSQTLDKVGSGAGGGGHDGRMCVWGIWDKELSTAEISALYNGGNGLTYTGLSGSLLTSLRGFWNLSEASGTRADSVSSNDLLDNNTVTGNPGPDSGLPVTQTSDLWQLQDGDSNIITHANKEGKIAIGSSTAPAAMLDIYADDAAEVGLIIRGAASQTANLSEWQNSSGTVLSKIKKYGGLDVSYTTGTTSEHALTFLTQTNNSGTIAEIRGISGQMNYSGSGTISNASGAFIRGLITGAAPAGANISALDTQVTTNLTASSVTALKITAWGNAGTGTLTNAFGLNIPTTLNSLSGSGGVVTNATAINISNQDAATNNWAIKTGTGIVQFGDALHLAEITTPTAITSYGAIYPKADNNLYFQDGAGVEKTIHDSDDTVNIDISLETYDAEPARSSETNLHGGLLSLATGQPLDSVPTDLVVTKGIGKVLIVVNAGSDLAGDITITGESIDRDTGASTPADTDTITVDSTTTDGSDTDGNGNTRHAFTGAYISSKWFTGTVTLSTTNLTLTDVDVYHVSFEQFNDSPNITLNTFDANIFTTNVNAEFDAYLYCLEVTGDKCDIARCSSLNVGIDGETAIANKYWRLRRGALAKALDGSSDGVWVDIHYSNSPAYVEDVNIKVWVTKTQSMTIV